MAGVKGQVALVTGAGRGIGRAIAELLASRGARVVAVARTEQELAQLSLEYVVADLGTPEGCAVAVTEAEQRCGPIAAILLASLFFGALHVDQIHSAFAAILGLYLGAIAYLAGSVRASLGCHVANNTAAVIGAAFTPGIEAVPTPSLVIAAAFSLGVLGWLWRHHRPAASVRTPKKEGPGGLQKRRGLDDS